MANRNSNTHGCVDVRGAAFNMNDFDRLPKGVREALANANQNWNCSQAYRAIKRGVRVNGQLRRYKSAEMIKVIHEHDAKQAAAHYAYLETGLPFARE
jgi:hypothetical protein